jgi:hypothetical protein
MEILTIAAIKTELKHKTPKELQELCIRLAKLKAENKELLTYALEFQHREDDFVQDCKREVSAMFLQVNAGSHYLAKKSIRKIARMVTKYSKLSSYPETSVKLWIHFCIGMKEMKLNYKESPVLINLYNIQIKKIKKLISQLHEDLQYDYSLILEEL